MKHLFMQRLVHRVVANEGSPMVASPHSVRGALVDAAPGVAAAQRWRQLQQRIDSYHVHQAIAQRCAPDIVAYHVCVFLRPRYSLGAPIV